MTETREPWALDREIVLTRVLDAPRERVFDAWTSESIGSWFGPQGFSCTTYELDVRVGGRWRFDMVGPDGTVYSNRVEYREVDRPKRLVFDHGSDVDDDPNRFLVTVTFDEQGDGKTVLTLRQLHPSAQRRDEAVKFGAVELGLQTLAKLADHLRGAGV